MRASCGPREERPCRLALCTPTGPRSRESECRKWRYLLRRQCLAVAALALLGTWSAAAVTRTWAGTNSGSWSDPANWGDTALGPGGITKSGWSRLTLSAMNTYSGATLVSQDYLEVNGSSPAIPITVSSTATTGGVWGTGTTGPIVVTAGSRNPDGTPVIPLNVLDAQHVAFELPAGAQPGPVSVMALNPPFTPYTSSGTDPGGAPTLPCERPEEDGNEGWQKCDA